MEITKVQITWVPVTKREDLFRYANRLNSFVESDQLKKDSAGSRGYYDSQETKPRKINIK